MNGFNIKVFVSTPREVSRNRSTRDIISCPVLRYWNWPVSWHCSLSIPPRKHKKTLSFLMFSGGIERDSRGSLFFISKTEAALHRCSYKKSDLKICNKCNGENPYRSVISKQLYLNNTSAWAFSFKSTALLQNTFF